MLCLGNICRSPLAEGILKDKITKNNLDWEVDSAGTDSWHVGENPDPRSIAIANAHGLEIGDYRARKLTVNDFRNFDRIFAMDKENFSYALELAENDEDRSKVEMIMNLVSPGSDQEIPDPYMNDDGFEEVYQMLDRSCTTFIEKELTNSNS